jgi:hypothetical protein
MGEKSATNSITMNQSGRIQLLTASVNADFGMNKRNNQIKR